MIELKVKIERQEGALIFTDPRITDTWLEEPLRLDFAQQEELIRAIEEGITECLNIDQDHDIYLRHSGTDPNGLQRFTYARHLLSGRTRRRNRGQKILYAVGMKETGPDCNTELMPDISEAGFLVRFIDVPYGWPADRQDRQVVTMALVERTDGQLIEIAPTHIKLIQEDKEEPRRNLRVAYIAQRPGGEYNEPVYFHIFGDLAQGEGTATEAIIEDLSGRVRTIDPQFLKFLT